MTHCPIAVTGDGTWLSNAPLTNSPTASDAVAATPPARRHAAATLW